MERQVWKRFAKPRYPIYHLKWNRLAFMSAEQFFDTITFIGCEKNIFFGRLISFHHNHARSIILQPKHSKTWNQNSTFLELGFWNGQSRSVSTDSLSVWRRERDLRGLVKFKMSRTRMQVLKLVHSFGFVFFFLLLLLLFFFSVLLFVLKMTQS